MSGLPPRPVAERLWDRVAFDDPDGCWLWMGHTNRNGHGQISAGGKRGQELYVHRVSYEALVGPIPEGLVLDHLCFVKRCVNPDHLEPVTNAENARRAWAAGLCTHIPPPSNPGARVRRPLERTHCINGHALVGDNLLPPGRADKRRCRACLTDRWRRREARRIRDRRRTAA